jgi:hypothetical protein
LGFVTCYRGSCQPVGSIPLLLVCHGSTPLLLPESKRYKDFLIESSDHNQTTNPPVVLLAGQVIWLKTGSRARITPGATKRNRP